LLHIVYGVLKSGKAFDPSFASWLSRRYLQTSRGRTQLQTAI